MRIIASLTTIPSRISRMRPVIEAILAQTTPIEHIEINVPTTCIRTGEDYVVPEWFADFQGKLKVFQTRDDGAITKIAPTLLRHFGEEDLWLWSVDDDAVYPPYQLAKLADRAASLGKTDVIWSRHGGTLDAADNISFWQGERDVDMFEGFGGIVYPPGTLNNAAEFAEYVARTSANADCRLSDDIVLSYYFREVRQPALRIMMSNNPTSECPFMPTVWQPYSSEPQSLCKQGFGGHIPRYRWVREFLKTNFKRQDINDIECK